ncbi:hypothetical protein RJT34_17454 [Clitoria ternatea]|uniref:Uncharacterized protein n=1 Tax=Clitoria ternatea TaxID=43366 RepID=A0AAN9J8Z6_CLITE
MKRDWYRTCSKCKKLIPNVNQTGLDRYYCMKSTLSRFYVTNVNEPWSIFLVKWWTFYKDLSYNKRMFNQSVEM